MTRERWLFGIFFSVLLLLDDKNVAQDPVSLENCTAKKSEDAINIDIDACMCNKRETHACVRFNIIVEQYITINSKQTNEIAYNNLHNMLKCFPFVIYVLSAELFSDIYCTHCTLQMFACRSIQH